MLPVNYLSQLLNIFLLFWICTVPHTHPVLWLSSGQQCISEVTSAIILIKTPAIGIFCFFLNGWTESRAWVVNMRSWSSHDCLSCLRTLESQFWQVQLDRTCLSRRGADSFVIVFTPPVSCLSSTCLCAGSKSFLELKKSFNRNFFPPKNFHWILRNS